jgi:epsilon-lactone hydrolase
MMMSNVDLYGGQHSVTARMGISAEERKRESALRERFANFWGTGSGDMRAVYDVFISATPFADGISVEIVDEMDVHGWWVRPKRALPYQATLYLHGGGYVQGSAQAYRGFVSQIVNRTQVPALVIDYPLAPEATVPAASAVALSAWRWLVALGFKRLTVVGDSAGGGLTLVTLAELVRLRETSKPVAGIVFSPWADLAFTGVSMTDPTVTDPLISYQYLQDCARKYLGDRGAFDFLASPLFGDLKGLPPLLIQVGTDERLLDDARQYAHRAALAGVSVQLEVWEGMHHVFQLDVAHLESSRLALDRAAHFMLDALHSRDIAP